jgi:hypothetical protein
MWREIWCVPLATEPDISLIVITPMKILQRNLNRSTFVVWEMKRNVSVVRFKFRCNILISCKIVKEMPCSVVSGTNCIKFYTPTGRLRLSWITFKDSVHTAQRTLSISYKTSHLMVYTLIIAVCSRLISNTEVRCVSSA